MKIKTVVAGIALSVAMAHPALAQKSKDTLRAVAGQPIGLIDRYYAGSPAITVMTRALFDSIVHYDPIERKFEPLLAKSWTQLGPDTIEFKLREDVKFHDGEPFDADDVVALFNFLIDPKSTFANRESTYGWIKEAQKLDKYTVRIVATGPLAPMMARLNFPIYPEHLHSKDPKNFGQTPVGTGFYKATNLDRNTGLTMVRNDGYNMATPTRPMPKINKVEFAQPMDIQTQVARMMRGEQDIMTSVEADQANDLGANPNFKVTVEDTIGFSLLILDVTARSGLAPLKDVRVRRAIAHAIDRRGIQNALLPKAAENIPLPGGMCHKWVTGCDWSTPLPEYNLEKAKQLLAEAGYPNGFELRITTWGPNKQLGELVGGQLHKIGIKTSSEHLIYTVYQQKQRSGEINIAASWWDNGSTSDVESTSAWWYSADREANDYVRDPELHAMHEKGRTIMDPAERQAHYKALFNKVNEQVLQLPMISAPATTVHQKDLIVRTGYKEPLVFNYLEWAK